MLAYLLGMPNDRSRVNISRGSERKQAYLGDSYYGGPRILLTGAKGMV